MNDETGLDDVRRELQISNKLMVLSLIRQGVRQKDLAATIGVSEGSLSKMFPKGLLKRVAQLSKSANSDSEM